MNVVAVRIGRSQVYYVKGFGIRGARGDLRRWAALCGHTIEFSTGSQS
jgi:hypothetical protein